VRPASLLGNNFTYSLQTWASAAGAGGGRDPPGFSYMI